MNLTDTAAYLTWLSQSDNRIQVTDANIQIWGNALQMIPTAEVKESTLEHYRTNDHTMPTPALIRKHALSARERGQAKQSALEATPHVRTAGSFRQRNPEEWDRLTQHGRNQYRADLRERGIEPHAETCPDCARTARTA